MSNIVTVKKQQGHLTCISSHGKEKSTSVKDIETSFEA
jgi:hypothetical protein